MHNAYIQFFFLIHKKKLFRYISDARISIVLYSLRSRHNMLLQYFLCVTVVQSKYVCKWDEKDVYIVVWWSIDEQFVLLKGFVFFSARSKSLKVSSMNDVFVREFSVPWKKNSKMIMSKKIVVWWEWSILAAGIRICIINSRNSFLYDYEFFFLQDL